MELYTTSCRHALYTDSGPEIIPMLSLSIMHALQVKIWDTAGSEKYMSISAVYYRKADGVIFVFDVTKPKSFTDIETIWMQAVEAPEQ